MVIPRVFATVLPCVVIPHLIQPAPDLIRGNPSSFFWIPAFAGMTKGAWIPASAGMTIQRLIILLRKIPLKKDTSRSLPRGGSFSD